MLVASFFEPTIPADRLHSTSYQRMCAIGLCLSTDSGVVESLTPIKVAARLGISRQSAHKTMRAYAQKMGLLSVFEQRMAKGGAAQAYALRRNTSVHAVQMLNGEELANCKKPRKGWGG